LYLRGAAASASGNQKFLVNALGTATKDGGYQQNSFGDFLLYTWLSYDQRYFGLYPHIKTKNQSSDLPMY
jgi:hypothetical protein